MLPGPLLCRTLALVLLVSAARAHDAADEMAKAANDFLTALAPEQRRKAQYEFQDDERFNWHYVPRARRGLPFKEMTQEQRSLAHALLALGLSPRGREKVRDIIILEDYYRVQGPTFLIEYDNTQNDANHIHAVWRDFENDFGEDLLRRHYEENPH